jgi:hypothetical protein
MSEMEGQMPLFTLDGTDDWIQRHYADEGEYPDDCDCFLCQHRSPGPSLGRPSQDFW